MQLKSITVLAVLLLVVVSLLVTGCTTSTTSNTNQTSSAATSTATHDAFLENYLAIYKNVSYADKNTTIKAWEVTWINSTSARLQIVGRNESANFTVSAEAIFIVFPTTQDATNYLNVTNKTGAYYLDSTEYSIGSYFGRLYQNVTGHAPTVFKDFTWTEGSESDRSTYKFSQLIQIDNLFIVTTASYISLS
jgi:hypothetical protein